MFESFIVRYFEFVGPLVWALVIRVERVGREEGEEERTRESPDVNCGGRG